MIPIKINRGDILTGQLKSNKFILNINYDLCAIGISNAIEKALGLAYNRNRNGIDTKKNHRNENALEHSKYFQIP